MRPFFLHAPNLTSIPAPGSCPHCELSRNIKRHGYLRGKGHNAASVIRGLRFYCSKRDSNRGCGGTFSILFAEYLPGYSVAASDLARLLTLVIRGTSVHAAWLKAISFFSLTSAYRWVRAFIANLSRTRPLLHSPDTTSANLPHPLALQTLRALEDLHPDDGGGGFIATFQHRFQRAFFRPPANSLYS